MNQNKAHWSFWLITTLMLIWSAMGCINFIMQMNPEMVSSYREIEQTIIQSRPLWVTIGFAISVFGGALGCIVLLLRNTLAFYVFLVSLVGTLIAVMHSLTLDIAFGVGEITGIIVLPILISALLIWFSKYSQKKGWLKNTAADH